MRRRAELDAVDALVIPGGESTTMSLLLREFGLLELLRQRLVAGMPAYGSCAGMILLADEILDAGGAGAAGSCARRDRHDGAPQRLRPTGGLLRGRHRLPRPRRPGARGVHPGPWVERVGPDVQVLARAGEHIVAVRQGSVLATAFHPEVTGDRRVHRLFVDILTGRADLPALSEEPAAGDSHFACVVASLTQRGSSARARWERSRLIGAPTGMRMWEI